MTRAVPRTATVPTTRALGTALRVALGALLAVGALSGCSAGLHAITSSEVAATYGINASAGTVLLRNALIRTSGTVSTIEVTFINTGTDPDTLLAVSTPIAASVSFTSNGAAVSSLTLPPTGPEGTQHPLAVTGSDPVITLVDVSAPPGVGTVQPVTLTFEKAGQVTLALPVVASAG